MATTNQMANDANTVGLWHMDGTAGTAAKQDNAQGDAALDLTAGAGNPTSTTGQITPTTDGAYAFTNTANKYLYIASANTFVPTGSSTWEFWINVNSGPPADTEGIWNTYAGGGNRGVIVYKTTDQKLNFGVSANGSAFTEIATPSGLSTGTWYYVACVYTAGSRMEIFVDGASVVSSTTSIPASMYASTGDLTFGEYTSHFGANNNFDGNLDEMRLSNIARTSTEIYNYYNDIGSTSIKTIDGLAKASVKTVDGLAIASVKTWNGLA